MQCKGKSKRSGERCKNHAATGKEVCHIHGGKSTGPKDQRENANAVKHGAYETLMRERLPQEQREAFDNVPTNPELAAELRILRFKLLRLLGDVEQNVVAGFNIKEIKADEPTKITGIVHLAGEIRKLVKEMKDTGSDDPLLELVDAWKRGMDSDAGHRVGSPE